MEISSVKDPLDGKKLELVYPCSWSYKLIAGEREALQKAIRDVIDEREHKLSHSNNSKGGKYISMNLEMIVHNEYDINFIYMALKAHQDIKMVL